MKICVWICALVATVAAVKIDDDLSLRSAVLEELSDGVEGISGAQKEGIVRMLNLARSRANPSAAKMIKVVWNDTVAQLAQEYISDCQTTGNYPQYPPGVFNLYRDSGKNPVDIMKIRGIEQSRYMNKTTGECIESGPPGLMQLLDVKCLRMHIYKAIMFEDLESVGCGMAFCGGPKKFMHACAVTIRKSYEYSRSPFSWALGPPCSACPKTYPNCEKNLCVK
jgi:hypothetical protein